MNAEGLWNMGLSVANQETPHAADARCRIGQEAIMAPGRLRRGKGEEGFGFHQNMRRVWEEATEVVRVEVRSGPC
jgi:hypothetical protein